MTFLEKGKQENRISNENHTIRDLCPSDLGYEAKVKCKAIIEADEKDRTYICRRCWEREMPNTEPKVYEDKEWLDGYEKGKIDGLNDAWDLICKINKLSIEESEKVYGKRFQYITDIIENLTPQEALEKLKAYEEAQNKIEIGDVVAWTDLSDDIFNGVVLDFKDNTDDEVVVFNKNGCVDVWKIAECKKTGKHIDISSILEQIGE